MSSVRIIYKQPENNRKEVLKLSYSCESSQADITRWHIALTEQKLRDLQKSGTGNGFPIVASYESDVIYLSSTNSVSPT